MCISLPAISTKFYKQFLILGIFYEQIWDVEQMLLVLGHHLHHWPNIKLAMDQRLLITAPRK